MADAQHLVRRRGGDGLVLHLETTVDLARKDERLAVDCEDCRDIRAVPQEQVAILNRLLCTRDLQVGLAAGEAQIVVGRIEAHRDAQVFNPGVVQTDQAFDSRAPPIRCRPGGIGLDGSGIGRNGARRVVALEELITLGHGLFGGLAVGERGWGQQGAGKDQQDDGADASGHGEASDGAK